MKTYEIRGERFTTLEGFYEEFGRVVIPGVAWGKNLDALDDVLRGGFGTPAGGFALRWTNHALSRQRLGHTETLRQLRARMKLADPTEVPAIEAQMQASLRGAGTTVFDWLVEILRRHGPGGAEESSGVRLLLA